jgi:hypothetical protein
MICSEDYCERENGSWQQPSKAIYDWNKTEKLPFCCSTIKKDMEKSISFKRRKHQILLINTHRPNASDLQMQTKRFPV